MLKPEVKYSLIMSESTITKMKAISLNRVGNSDGRLLLSDSESLGFRLSVSTELHGGEMEEVSASEVEEAVGGRRGSMLEVEGDQAGRVGWCCENLSTCDILQEAGDPRKDAPGY